MLGAHVSIAGRVPRILETPKASPLDDRRNLKRLRSLVKGRKKGRHA